MNYIINLLVVLSLAKNVLDCLLTWVNEGFVLAITSVSIYNSFEIWISKYDKQKKPVCICSVWVVVEESIQVCFWLIKEWVKDCNILACLAEKQKLEKKNGD
jgi:hypothetical protein